LLFIMSMNSISHSVALPLPCRIISATELGELLHSSIINIFIYIYELFYSILYMIVLILVTYFYIYVNIQSCI
jgi:hypothetical protein